MVKCQALSLSPICQNVGRGGVAGCCDIAACYAHVVGLAVFACGKVHLDVTFPYSACTQYLGSRGILKVYVFAIVVGEQLFLFNSFLLPPSVSSVFPSISVFSTESAPSSAGQSFGASNYSIPNNTFWT